MSYCHARYSVVNAEQRRGWAVDRYVSSAPVRPQSQRSRSRPVASISRVVSLPSVRAVFRRMDEEGEERRAKQFPNSPPATVYFTNVYP